MNSISRAVTSRFNDISNKRQRLVGEGKDSDFVNPSWMDPTTSDFNCFEPPELIISEEDWNETTSIGPKVEKPKMILEVKASNNISKKVTSVVRRLSPFGSSNNLSKEKEEEKHEGNEEKKSQKIFKETSDGADDEAVAELVIKKRSATSLAVDPMMKPQMRNKYRLHGLNNLTVFVSTLNRNNSEVIRGKMDRIKKSFKTNERQQLIDSDEEQ